MRASVVGVRGLGGGRGPRLGSFFTCLRQMSFGMSASGLRREMGLVGRAVSPLPVFWGGGGGDRRPVRRSGRSTSSGRACPVRIAVAFSQTLRRAASTGFRLDQVTYWRGRMSSVACWEALQCFLELLCVELISCIIDAEVRAR